MLSSLSLGVKARKYFVSSSDIFLDKKTLLKIWLNPGLNLTIFRGTRPRSSNCCVCEMKHATGMETCTKIYFFVYLQSSVNKNS